MMFGKFFDTAEIDALAAWVATELRQALPPAQAAAPAKKTQEKLRKLDLLVARRVSELAQRGGLNFYKKAKFGTRVQAALDEAGYPAEFSKQYVVDLVSLAAVADRQAPR